jgi:DNA-binding protein WhiA
VVEAELDTDSAARRLGRDIAEVFGHRPDVVGLAPDGLRRAGRFLVRVARDGESLARQAGLLDGRGRPVRGLSPRVVSGATCDAEAAWRGAFLARGSLSGRGRAAALEVVCPGPEAALALAGAARRIGVRSRVGERHGVQRVVIREDDAIGAMLARLGAGGAVLAWQERRARGETRGPARRLTTFDDANLHRATRAAAAASCRVERALQILGEAIPEHLRAAGQLRLEHRQASLEELGRLADPPMTKDAVAGRIRRLLAVADRHAADLGVPGTNAGLAPALLNA